MSRIPGLQHNIGAQPTISSLMPLNMAQSTPPSRTMNASGQTRNFDPKNVLNNVQATPVTDRNRVAVYCGTYDKGPHSVYTVYFRPDSPYNRQSIIPRIFNDSISKEARRRFTTFWSVYSALLQVERMNIEIAPRKLLMLKLVICVTDLDVAQQLRSIHEKGLESNGFDSNDPILYLLTEMYYKTTQLDAIDVEFWHMSPTHHLTKYANTMAREFWIENFQKTEN
jgi:hypothetical protein